MSFRLFFSVLIRMRKTDLVDYNMSFFRLCKPIKYRYQYVYVQFMLLDCSSQFLAHAPSRTTLA